MELHAEHDGELTIKLGDFRSFEEAEAWIIQAENDEDERLEGAELVLSCGGKQWMYVDGWEVVS